MKRVIVASQNPVKIAAAREAWTRMFPDDACDAAGVAVSSGVSHQPMGDEETRQGALSRAAAAAAAHPAADFWIGIEGGVADTANGMEAFAWVAVYDDSGRVGLARSASFFLPPAVTHLIRQGKELGEADDIVFGRTNSKQENGAVGILTGNAIERRDYYREAAIMALIPFKNEHLYFV